MQDLIFWGSIVGQILLAINVMVSILRLKLYPSFFQWFIFFLVTAMVIQIIAKVFWFQHWNNLPLLHLYTPLEFIFLSLFYRGLLGKLELRHFTYFIIIGVVFILCNSVFIQPIKGFNSIAKTFTQVAYISYALMYFFNLDEHQHKALRLINSAILIYYSASLFIFMFTNLWNNLKDFYPYNEYLWIANIFFDIFFQIIVLYSLWKTGLQQTKSSS